MTPQLTANLYDLALKVTVHTPAATEEEGGML